MQQVLPEDVALSAGDPWPDPQPFADAPDCVIGIDRLWLVTGISRAAQIWLGLDETVTLGRDIREAGLPRRVSYAVQQAFDFGEASRATFPSSFRPGASIEVLVQARAGGADLIFQPSGGRPRPLRRPSVLAPAFDVLSWPMTILDRDGRLLDANAAWHDFASIGIAPTATPGADLLGAEGGVVPGLSRLFRRARRALHAGAREFEGSCAGGQGRRLDVRLVPFRHRNGDAWLLLLQDVTELAQARAQAKRATERIIAAREAERRRIAMELHDSTGQQLVAIGLAVSRLRSLVADGREAASVLDELAASIADAQRDVRTLSFLIHPPSSGGEPIGAAVRALAEGFARRARIEMEVDVRLPPRALSQDGQRALFRMVQEALVNIHRHSGAAHVCIRAGVARGVVQCEVRDDGRGFPAGRRRLGEGLHAMHSRIRQLGGQLQIRSGCAGAALVARWPAQKPATARPPTSVRGQDERSPAAAPRTGRNGPRSA
ncbi:histidine kinase [Caulobacter sp.]|uniref:sensor histidine kinase n=1 Tax=Caulobacter sp. TaxID=78 RepID=UPI003BAFCFEF